MPNSQRGQTVVAITFLMLIALGIGVTISTSFFKNLRMVANIDSAGRALGVAEAAAERLLLESQQTLQDYITYGNCGANCTLQITGDDGVDATATVVLSYVGNSTENYQIALKKTETTEVNLTGYPNGQNVSVCWNSLTGDLPAVTVLFFYGTSGSYSTDNYAYNSIGSTYSNGFSTASSNYGYTNCFTVTGKTNPVALRIKPLYADVTAFVVPTAGATIPMQGILITSTGVFGDALKTIKVTKSFSHSPTLFDYVLYQKTPDYPLSN